MAIIPHDGNQGLRGQKPGSKSQERQLQKEGSWLYVIHKVNTSSLDFALFSLLPGGVTKSDTECKWQHSHSPGKLWEWQQIKRPESKSAQSSFCPHSLISLRNVVRSPEIPRRGIAEAVGGHQHLCSSLNQPISEHLLAKERLGLNGTAWVICTAEYWYFRVF